ncbi:hypothetical protein LP415_07365 [Polaromonas sp. P1(28)-8]|nr:hypothetical protein LP415_07365 [Polaromonas sp. P1(28)-8]
MNRRKAITLACAAAAGLSRPTLGLATGKPSSDGVVRLGQSTALTGANGAVGRQFHDAALGWFNLANSQGGAGAIASNSLRSMTAAWLSVQPPTPSS